MVILIIVSYFIFCFIFIVWLIIHKLKNKKKEMSKVNKQTSDEPEGLQVGKSKFIVGQFIAGGSFGRLYLGKHTETGKEVAIKMEKKSIDKPQLHLEYGFYKQLGSYRGIPKIYFFGPCGNWNALVMDLLGPSLQKMMEKCEGSFTLKTVVQLAVQLICLMEFIHSRGILYRDTKPENFLMGLPMSPKWYIVNVIDMGLCKYWREEDGSHILFQEGKCLTGTVRYMSINNHMGHEQSRRDDLEAVGYMLIYFFKGRLPWQGIQAESIAEKYYKIGQNKMEISMTSLCDKMPEEFAEYMNTVKNYQFEEEPDYRKLVNMFVKLLGKLGFEMNDKIYDWDRKHNPKPSHLRIN